MYLSGEHWLVRYKHRYKKEQVWILVSRDNGKFLSAYKDTLRIVRKSKQEILDEELREQEKKRESSVNAYYKGLIKTWKIYQKSSVNVCLSPSFILHDFYSDKVNSAHLQKIDSMRRNVSKRDTIDPHSFRQKLKYLYVFSDELNDIDAVTAMKIGMVAASECYGSEMTPFKTRLMGENKEHWMVYCFPTVPDNIELQKRCYDLRISQYQNGMWLNFTTAMLPSADIDDRTGCPAVFMVLISKENGQVLFIDVPI